MRSFDRRTLMAAGAALAAWPRLHAAQDSAKAAPVARKFKTRFAVNGEIWWSGLPFHERIAKTARHGMDALEFWPWRGKDLAAIEKASKDHGVEIAQFTAWGFTPGMNDPANHAQVVAEVTESCKVAQRLNCKAMTVVAGNDRKDVSQAEMHSEVIKALKLCAPVARDHGVTLILEPMNIRVDHKGHCLYGSAPAIRICQEVASPFVKINWDLYHMHISEGDLCGHLREGVDWIGYVQLADHPGRNEPGTGEIHYNRVLKELAAIGYAGMVGLECWPKDGEDKALERLAAADVW